MSESVSKKSTATGGRTKPALDRLIKIHGHLRDGMAASHLTFGSEVPKNATFFAKELEVSTKTVLRDLEYMRDKLGLPLEYDKTGHCYYYTREVTEFPLIKITEGELTALFIAKAALHQYKGSPYAGALRSALGKLEDSLKSEMEVDLDAMSRAISFRSAGSPVPDETLFEKLADAVMHRKVVSFDYLKNKATASERRTVLPYHLTHYGTRWYLIAHDEARGDIRQFLLVRMSATKVEKRTFPAPADFSAESFYQNSFGVFVAGAEHRVVVRFEPAGAELVRDGDWHPSQVMRELAGGGLEISLCVSSLEEVARWVVSFSGHAEAIAPPELRAKVRELVSGVLARHG